MIERSPDPAAGLNTPPLIPVPLYTPPAGCPPVRVIGVAFTQRDAKFPSVTTGKAFTTIFVCAELVQPFEFV